VDVQQWHSGGKEGARNCQGGIAIFSHGDGIIPIIVADREGSGCHKETKVCSNNYEMNYQVKTGLNILSWCLATHVHIAGDTYVKIPDDIKSTYRGPCLYIGKSDRYQSDRYTAIEGAFVNQNGQGLDRLLAGERWVQQPGLNYLRARSYLNSNIKLDHIMVCYPPGEQIPPWMADCLKGGIEALMAGSAWHFSHLGHKLVNRHFWPRECHCASTTLKGHVIRPSKYLKDTLYVTPSDRMLALLTTSPKIVEDEDGNIYHPPDPRNEEPWVEVTMKPRIMVRAPGDRIVTFRDVTSEDEIEVEDGSEVIVTSEDEGNNETLPAEGTKEDDSDSSSESSDSSSDSSDSSDSDSSDSSSDTSTSSEAAQKEAAASEGGPPQEDQAPGGGGEEEKGGAEPVGEGDSNQK